LRLPGDEVAVTTLSPEAGREWVAWYDENQRLTGRATGLAAGRGAKAPVHGGRIALVLHLLTHATEREKRLSGSAMRDAIAVVEYFRAHLARVLPAFGATGSAVAAGLPARLHRILANDGGWGARSVLAERLGGHEPAERVTTTLTHLKQTGRAERQTVATGGRSREEWRLIDLDGDETSCGKTGNDGESPAEEDEPTLFPSFHVFPHGLFPSDEEHDEPTDGDPEEDWEEVEDDRTNYQNDETWESWEEAL
jgi:hypothetical protein